MDNLHFLITSKLLLSFYSSSKEKNTDHFT